MSSAATDSIRGGPPEQPSVADEPGRSRRGGLIGTAVALMATTATNSGLGVIFWAIASHLHSAARLGEDVALISAMLLLSIVSQLNLGMGIARLLPQVLDRPGRVVAACYALTAATAVVVTLAFVVVAPTLTGSFDFLAGNAKLVVALVAGVALWNVFTLQDSVLTSARWAPLVPVENGIFGIVKIVLVVVLAGAAVSHGVFYAWLAAALLVLVPINGIIFARVLRSPRSPRDPDAHRALALSDRPRVARYLLADYFAALLSQGYKALLPLLVLAALGAAANAYFYIAFLVAGAVGELSWSLSTSLVVQGGHDESDVSGLARRSVVFYLRFVAPCVLVLIVAAPLVLRPFGVDYADHATTLLRLLLAATLPQAVVTLYLGVERVRARVSRVIAAEAAVVALVTGGAILGMRADGLSGMGVAWLLGQAVVALAVGPRLWHACRPSSGGRREVLA